MKNILKKISSFALIALIGGALLATAAPITVSAADPCNRGFLGFPAWYDGLTDGDCNIVDPGTLGNGLSEFIWRIVLNIIEIVLGLLGYISAGFILYGGFLFIASNGKPESAAKGRKTMLDAIIGLVIAMGSIAIVSFIADKVIK